MLPAAVGCAVPAPAVRPGPTQQMEPRAQRRRRSRQLVAAFLRDPGSGRVYRRGKLIGKVGVSARAYTHPSSKTREGGELEGSRAGREGTRDDWHLRSPEFGVWAAGQMARWEPHLACCLRACAGRVCARVSRALSIPWVHNWCSTRNGEAVTHAPPPRGGC